jgi:hypothetical protein
MRSVQTVNNFFPARMMDNRHRRLMERTVRRTYAGWMARFPRWVNAGFDEYFLLHDAMPLLYAMLTGVQNPDPAQLARQWASAYRLTEDRAQRALVEATPIAADFLARLEIEYCAQQA